jgi:hypothetical protein
LLRDGDVRWVGRSYGVGEEAELEWIVEVQRIELVPIEREGIRSDERCTVRDIQKAGNRVGRLDEDGVLFDADPGSLSGERSDGAQLADAGADIEHPGVRARAEQSGCADGDIRRCPMHGGEVAKILRHQPIEDLVEVCIFMPAFWACHEDRSSIATEVKCNRECTRNGGGTW